jgi:glycine/D-amino acid oxidase-like deaminating enzyme
VMPDVVIIGAGIMGCASAYFLSKAGLKVRLIDRGAIGSGASKAGMMHVVTWEEPAIHLSLAAESRLLYAELSETLPLDIQYRQTGSIAVVEQAEGYELFANMIQRLQAGGLSCRMLSAQDLLEMEPNISPQVAGGAFFPNDAQVNPLLATLALAQAAQALGAVIEPFTAVTGFEISAQRKGLTAVLTSKGRLPTQNVVIAAGAWSAEVGKLAGIEIPIKPRKGTLVVTAPVADDFMNCKVILAAGYMESVKTGLGSGISAAANIQQARNGNLVLGSSRQFVDYDDRVDPQVAALILRRCLTLFPGLAKVPAIRMWAGFRPYTPDNLPIISPVEGLAGMYIAAGHEGIGITEGPITGKLISQLVTGQTPAIPLESLSLSRFEVLAHSNG